MSASTRPIHRFFFEHAWRGATSQSIRRCGDPGHPRGANTLSQTPSLRMRREDMPGPVDRVDNYHDKLILSPSGSASDRRPSTRTRSAGHGVQRRALYPASNGSAARRPTASSRSYFSNRPHRVTIAAGVNNAITQSTMTGFLVGGSSNAITVLLRGGFHRRLYWPAPRDITAQRHRLRSTGCPRGGSVNLALSSNTYRRAPAVTLTLQLAI